MADNEAQEQPQEQTQNKTEIISIRLDPLTKAKLSYICDLEYRPMALQIRKVIEDFIRKYEVENRLMANGKYNGDLNYPGNYEAIPF